MSGPRYRLLSGAELRKRTPIAWAIEGLVPQTGLALLYGASGASKSFLVLDMGCTIAEGRSWFGRATTQAPVIYVCLEGAGGLVGRVRAWEAAHGRPFPALVRLVLQQVNLLDAADVRALERAVGEWLAQLPGGLGKPIIIIDTLNRAMPGGDESLGPDMSMLLNACERLTQQCGGLTLLVHHVGKDGDRGPRGHSSLLNAADVSILVHRSGKGRQWEVKKLKDAADGLVATFELETVTFAQDEHGTELSSCVVRPILEAQVQQAVPDLPAPLRAALRSLRDALPDGALASATGEATDAVAEDASVATLKVGDWREKFYAQSSSGSADVKRAAFHRARTALSERGFIAESDGVLTVRAMALAVMTSLTER